MKHLFKTFYKWIVVFGLDPIRTFRALIGLPLFIRNTLEFKRQRKYNDTTFQFGKLYPCLEDRFLQSGKAEGHYFYQDLVIAKRIYENSPNMHVDIGSRIDGFVAHVASFRMIEVFDIRELKTDISNIHFSRVDLMEPLENKFINYCDSLSCLHALEHFGLGRYGDPIRYNGHLLGFENIYKILKRNGKFYFSVPIGSQRIEFNAHRVFSIHFLLVLFDGKYVIDNFSYVDDLGRFHENIPLTDNDVANSFGCHYGCGIFEMTKV